MELEEFKKKISGKDQQLLVTIKDPVTSKTINYSVSNNTTLWRAQSLFEKYLNDISQDEKYTKEID